jgi:L-asparagine transporter-like permease
MVREGMQTSTDTVTAIIFLIAFGIGMLVTGFNFTTGTSISREGKVFIS